MPFVAIEIYHCPCKFNYTIDAVNKAVDTLIFQPLVSISKQVRISAVGDLSLDTPGSKEGTLDPTPRDIYRVVYTVFR